VKCKQTVQKVICVNVDKEQQLKKYKFYSLTLSSLSGSMNS